MAVLTGMWYRPSDFECFKLLVEAKADVNKMSWQGGTVLHRAAYYGRDKCVALLLENKAENLCSRQNFTPLHGAANRGKLGVLLLILQSGHLDLEIRATDGRTPLCEAIAHDNKDCAMALLDAGAKVNNVNVRIPDWVQAFLAQRNAVRQSALVFLGILRRRLVVRSKAAAPGNRLPREMVQEIGFNFWQCRRDPCWAIKVAEEEEVKAKDAGETFHAK